MSATATITESAQLPSLRMILMRHCVLYDTPIGCETRVPTLDLGDVFCVEYPCSTVSTGAEAKYTFICNIATKVWEAWNLPPLSTFTLDRDPLALWRHRGPFIGNNDACRSSYWKSFYPDGARYPRAEGAARLQKYLSDNLEGIVGCIGDLGAQSTPVRRVLFMVTEVTRRITSRIRAKPLKPRTREALSSASGIENSNTDVDSSGGPYWFHPNPTISAETDTPNSWGYWSTSRFPKWAPPEERGEDTIPTLTDKKEFERLILNGSGVGAFMEEDSNDNYTYQVRILDERVIL
ncbi:hypothetical protein PLICRDRAFT_438201 [Plicaturopsis crispa FD-325 SS-3]|uniref:Uncharacterized protein n=1 Tax=Plicaturopsis crispa FD-325 SS-3 TaxID=944288 RepID=A0A0C9SQF9_PLICR|nr:hypothetical protein PLICRDRAFT_438201 [Plicaturopsis crispa FD-325 SS-3]